MKPTDKLMAWKSDDAVSRIHACAVMLSLHGFLSDAEAERVKARIKKWVRKHQAGEKNK